MKKIIPILLIAFAPLFSKAQNYTPMNLDTSSFWVHRYYQYQGQLPGHTTGEMISYVQKDTIINGISYFKIRAYLSKLYHNGLYLGQLFFKNHNTFIREDTSARKVFIYDAINARDSLYIDFNLSVNDTVDSYPFPAIFSLNPIVVDSVIIKSIMGVNRKVTYYNHPGVNNPVNAHIEGVGMRYQFPFNFAGGEWGAPGFTCLCYSKGQTVQYRGLNSPGYNLYSADSCYKKSEYIWPLPWPNNVNEIVKKTIKTIVNKNYVRINNPIRKLIVVQLITIGGRVVSSIDTSQKSLEFNLNHFPSGIYVLTVQSSEGIENRKILIR